MDRSRAHFAALGSATNPSFVNAAPSSSLLRAALSGLLAVSAAACDDEQKEPNWACQPTGATDSGTPVAPAVATDAGIQAPVAVDAGSVQAVVDAGGPLAIPDASAPHTSAPGAGAPDAAAPDAGALGDGGPIGPITTKETEGNVTFVDLKSQCAALGGYAEVHAACGGANTCKGFSYGDWNPGVLTEHTCASANGCTGLSCVVLPADGGKTGKQVYETDKFPVGGPSSCLNCHAVWSGKDAAGNYLPPDATKFKVWVMPGSTRTEQNWLDLSADAQEAVVAFGRVGVMPDGTAQVSMRGYHQVFSRAETQRVVQHIRTLTPVLAEIKAPK